MYGTLITIFYKTGGRQQASIHESVMICFVSLDFEKWGRTGYTCENSDHYRPYVVGLVDP